MYDEAGKHLHNIMLQAEEARIPYEILPGPCELISTLSASGFPADRFGIEYFACQQGTEKLDNLLKERKNQNFSLAMMEKRSNLERLLHRASVVFGEKQLAYIVTNLHTVRKELRMPIAECIEQLEKQPIPSKQELAQNCIVIIAPYAMDYNEELKERKFQRSQAVDEINEDEEVATHKLKKLEQKIKSLTDPKSYKVDGVEAIKYLLTVVPEESQVIQLVKQLLRIGDRDAERLVATARLQGTDILHIEHEQLKRRK
jgi:16S rRNA C1402 (ribose-2'-O) methylase RsmI